MSQPPLARTPRPPEWWNFSTEIGAKGGSVARQRRVGVSLPAVFGEAQVFRMGKLVRVERAE